MASCIFYLHYRRHSFFCRWQVCCQTVVKNQDAPSGKIYQLLLLASCNDCSACYVRRLCNFGDLSQRMGARPSSTFSFYQLHHLEHCSLVMEKAKPTGITAVDLVFDYFISGADGFCLIVTMIITVFLPNPHPQSLPARRREVDI